MTREHSGCYQMRRQEHTFPQEIPQYQETFCIDLGRLNYQILDSNQFHPDGLSYPQSLHDSRFSYYEFLGPWGYDLQIAGMCKASWVKEALG